MSLINSSLIHSVLRALSFRFPVVTKKKTKVKEARIPTLPSPPLERGGPRTLLFPLV